MATFRVLAGKHITKEGDEYKKNQEVESDQDLDVDFPGKFERTSAKTKRGRDVNTNRLDKKTDVTLSPHVAAKMQKAQQEGKDVDDEVDTDDVAEEDDPQLVAEGGEETEEPQEVTEGEDGAEEVEEVTDEEPPAPKPKPKAKAPKTSKRSK